MFSSPFSIFVSFQFLSSSFHISSSIPLGKSPHLLNLANNNNYDNKHSNPTGKNPKVTSFTSLTNPTQTGGKPTGKENVINPLQDSFRPSHFRCKEKPSNSPS